MLQRARIWFFLFLLVCVPFCRADIVYVDAAATGSDTGLDWANAYPDLQSALGDATASDEIWVAAGIYLPSDTGNQAATFQLVADTATYGGFTSGMSVRSQRDWVNHPTYLSGDLSANDAADWANRDENSEQVVTAADDAVLDGFAITGSRLTDVGISGGGVYVADATGVEIRNCVFVNNFTEGETEGSGLGVGNTGSATVEDCLFVDNMGGEVCPAVFCGEADTVFDRCVIVGNASDFLGAGGMGFQGTTGSAELRNLLIAANTGGWCGGVVINGAPTSDYRVDIVNCTFSRNAANNNAGALYVRADSDVFVTNSIFWADTGATGEIENNAFSPGNLVVGYSDVSGGWTGTSNINSNPQFAAAPSGTWSAGAVFTVSTRKTVLTDISKSWTPGALVGQLVNPDTSQPRQYYIVTNSATALTVWGDASAGLSGASYQVYDYRLAAGSPCIDSGVSTVDVPDDLDGIRRPMDNGTDMGAHESRSETTAPADVGGISIAAAAGDLTFSWTNPSDADFEGVLFLRRTGSAPGGVPTPGVPYGAGDIVGDEVVAYSGPGTDGAPSSGSIWTNSGLLGSTTYHYRLFSYDGHLNYASGVPTNGTTLADVQPPDPVSSLTSTQDSAQVSLSWVNPADPGFEGVLIVRKTGSAPTGTPVHGTEYTVSEMIGDGAVVYAGPGDSGTPGAASGWLNTGLSDGTTYFYEVFAYDGDRNYASGEGISETPIADTFPPLGITGLQATAGRGEVALSWTNSTTADSTGVLVVRKTGSAPTGNPVNGTTYTAGNGIGDGTVVYVGAGTVATPGLASSWTDTTVDSEIAYYYKVYARDEVPNYSSAVSANATTPDATAPANVSNLNALGGVERVDLTWTNPGAIDFAGVLILRRQGSYPTGVPQDTFSYSVGNFIGDAAVVYAGAGNNGAPGAASGWSDTGLGKGETYYYRVFTRDEVPNYSSGTNGNATTYIDSTPPGDVVSLTAVGGDARIDMAWTNPAALDFTGVVILHKNDSAITATLVNSQTYTAGESVGDATVLYVGTGTDNVPGVGSGWWESGLGSEQTVHYKVFSHDDVPNYPAGVSTFATTTDTAAPDDPSGGTAAGGDRLVILSWTNPPQAEYAGVLILRRQGAMPTGTPSPKRTYTAGETIGDGSVVYVGTAGPGVPGAAASWTNTGLPNVTSYGYKLFSYDEIPNYSAGAEVPGASLPDSTPTAPVTGLGAVGGDGSVALSWTNPSDEDFQRVLIVRKADSAPTGSPVHTNTYAVGATIGDGRVAYVGAGSSGTPGAASGWTDQGLLNLADYYYDVYAMDEVPNYAAAAGASASTTADGGPPANVGGLTATPQPDSMLLEWDNPADPDFEGVLILKSETGIPTGAPANNQTYVVGTALGDATVAYVGTGAGSGWLDAGLENLTYYYYKVFAYDENPYYASGSPVSARTLAPLPIVFVDDTATGNDDGTTWINAYTNLQDGLASARVSGYDVWIAEGTYYPGTAAGAKFDAIANVGLYGGFGGGESSVDDRDWVAHPTILSGDINKDGILGAGNSTRIMYVSGADNAVIDGLIFRMAYGPSVQGACMYVASPITVRNCIFEDSFAYEGAGVHNTANSTYDSCIFRRCSTTRRAGAFQNYTASPTIINCLFYENYCDSVAGAVNIYHNTATMYNCTFANNSSGDIVEALYMSNGGYIRAVNCIFWDTGAHGGGIYLKQPGQPNEGYGDFVNCVIRDGFTAPANGTAVGTITDDPLFVDEFGEDFHLQDDSPAIDTGISDGGNAPDHDLDAGDRPIGVGWDIGAYEFGSSGPRPQPTGVMLFVY